MLTIMVNRAIVMISIAISILGLIGACVLAAQVLLQLSPPIKLADYALALSLGATTSIVTFGFVFVAATLTQNKQSNKELLNEIDELKKIVGELKSSVDAANQTQIRQEKPKSRTVKRTRKGRVANS